MKGSPARSPSGLCVGDAVEAKNFHMLIGGGRGGSAPTSTEGQSPDLAWMDQSSWAACWGGLPPDSLGFQQLACSACICLAVCYSPVCCVVDAVFLQSAPARAPLLYAGWPTAMHRRSGDPYRELSGVGTGPKGPFFGRCSSSITYSRPDDTRPLQIFQDKQLALPPPEPQFKAAASRTATTVWRCGSNLGVDRGKM